MWFIPDILSSSVMSIIIVVVIVIIIIITSSASIHRFTAWSPRSTVTSFSAISSFSTAIPIHGFRCRFARKWSYRVALFATDLSSVFSFFFPAFVPGFQSSSSPVLGFEVSDAKVLYASDCAEDIQWRVPRFIGIS